MFFPWSFDHSREMLITKQQISHDSKKLFPITAHLHTNCDIFCDTFRLGNFTASTANREQETHKL